MEPHGACFPIEVQGHRGARGLAPENTLAGFEIALDLGVDSIETDVHLTQDDVIVLFHDPVVTAESKPLVRSLPRAALRELRVAGPSHGPTPLAERFGNVHGIPTLADFFAFVAAYAGADGAEAGKNAAQRDKAARLIFDIELKRVPFEPENIGDGYDGSAPALLERLVLDAILQAGVIDRVRVRSFDHRCVRAVKQLAASMATGILVYHTVPADIGSLLEEAGADVYCPDYRFVDADVVRQVHAAKRRILPYTVNEPRDWERLIAWGVDGITTDYPDRLIVWLGAGLREQ
jgi:glycerophosphoryl diester phosphodiesterase